MRLGHFCRSKQSGWSRKSGVGLCFFFVEDLTPQTPGTVRPRHVAAIFDQLRLREYHYSLSYRTQV